MNVVKTVLLYIVSPIVFLWLGYVIQKKGGEPTFHVEPVTTIIVDKNNIEGAPINITRGDGKPITNNIIFQNLLFFNQGRLTIKPENVYAPIRVKLSDSTNQILELRVLRTSGDFRY